MPVNAITSATASSPLSVVNDINLQRQILLAEQAAQAAALHAEQTFTDTPAPGGEVAAETAASVKAQLAHQLESELALNLYSATTLSALATSSAFANLLTTAAPAVDAVLANNQQFQDAASNANALNALLATTISFDSPDLSSALLDSALLSAEGALLTPANSASTASNLPAISQSAADIALQIALTASQHTDVANGATAQTETLASNTSLAAAIGDVTARDVAGLASDSSTVFLQDLLTASVNLATAQTTPDIGQVKVAAAPIPTAASSATANNSQPQPNLAGNTTATQTPPTIASPAAPTAVTLPAVAANTPALQQQAAQNSVAIPLNTLITNDPAYATFVASFYNRALADRQQNSGASNLAPPASLAVPTVAAIHAIDPLTDLPPRGSDSAYWLQHELASHR